MRGVLPFLAAALLLPSALSAHRPDVYMTRVALKADGDSLRARVEVTAMAWMVEVSGGVEGDLWPEDKLKLSLDYLDKNLSFAVDGKPLAGRVLKARYVREPWMSEYSAVLAFDLLYPLPPGGRTFTARPRIFIENWEENEGAHPESASLPGARDFRTRFRWSLRPGGGRTVTLQAPDFSVPLPELRRSRWEARLESGGLGLSAFAGLGGWVALLLSAALFPPGPLALRAGSAAAALAAAAGAFLPWPADERILWAMVSLLGVSSVVLRRAPWWIAGLCLGAAAAARLGVSEGASLREATAFARFSPAAFGAGFLAPLAAIPLLARAAALAHRRSFRYLTAQEYDRQALFHRKIISRLLALAGFYWVLSPVWGAPR